MKKYIFLAISALTLASCQTDDFLGDTPGNNPSYAPKAISFGGTTGKISRAELNGAAAAEKLHNSFIVYGTKKVSETETQTVFNNYKVTYDDATNKWTYAKTDGQSLKYWDYAATQYDFVAFSLAGNNMGEGENDIKVVKDENLENPTFTLTGKVSALKSCYIADPVSVTEKDKFGKDIQFTFRSTGTKVSVGIYETIPGYNIKDINFYRADDTETATSDQPVLYASSACFSSSEENGTGTMKLTFNQTSFTSKLTVDNPTTGTGTETKNIEFTGFSFGTNNFLGTERNSATTSGAIYVSPINIEDGLTMKVDYTLISTDGSDETITVKGATVNVPKDYTNWEENHHYTYIFKITDSTNGSTGGNITGLKPIVFDAIVSEELGGTHTTETTFKPDGSSTTEDITNGGN